MVYLQVFGYENVPDTWCSSEMKTRTMQYTQVCLEWVAGERVVFRGKGFVSRFAAPSEENIPSEKCVTQVPQVVLRGRCSRITSSAKAIINTTIPVTGMYDDTYPDTQTGMLGIKEAVSGTLLGK